MEIISMDVKAFDALAGHVEAIERKAEALCRRQEDVSLKKWLDNQDVCDVLGISKRTLQTYREKGLLPFSRIRHKIFYKPEDVGKLLQSSHYPNTAALRAIISSTSTIRVWRISSGAWKRPARHWINWNPPEAGHSRESGSSPTRNCPGC